MKTKIILACLFLTLISCKKEENNKTESQEEIVDNTKDLFKVSMDLLIKKNDTLHLYYTEDGSVNFNEESSIWQSISGKDANQEITFNLPQDVYPTQFRIDFGVNKVNEEIVLRRIKFDYLEKSFIASDSMIFMYFRPDESNSIVDKTKKTLRRKDKNQYTISLYPHQDVLGKEIMNLAK
jgi:hypothetical protein